MVLNNIDGVYIPFDEKWRSIAISVSGGADSALLAYLLCSIVNGRHLPEFKIHIISHIRMWKTRPWQQHDSLNVYNWLVKKFPTIPFQRHINFIAPELEYGNIGPTLVDEYGKTVSGDNIEQRAFAEYVCCQYNAGGYYNAVTRNPKGVDFKGMAERDIDPTEENVRLLAMVHMDRWALHPFRFTEKSWVLKQYKKFDLSELLDLTRSCEGEFKDIDYKTYIPGQYVPTCGECFWCKEREWAIEQSK
jgi:hypothetical protein